jgi:soluble lytic murein transglycosylase-like protein
MLFVAVSKKALRKIDAMRKTWLATLLSLVFSGVVSAACFDDAATRYGVPASMLRSISRVESGGRPDAVNRNADGSVDLGHMQINSRWLPTLQRYGIDQTALFNPCTNTYVGAWILAQNIRRIGYDWMAIGAYNARSPEKRLVYAKKVAAILRREGVM